jgi:predicted peptidase
MSQSLRLKNYAGIWGAVIALLLCTLIAAPEAAAQRGGQRAGSEVEEAWMKLYEPHADKDMPYRIMKPVNFDSKKRYPVIVSLHGGGGTGTDNRKQLRAWTKPLADEKLRTDYPSYVLAPQAERLWDATHLRKIKEIINELPSVDMSRIYVLGHSMGGHGINVLLQIDTEYFAAAVPSAGTGKANTEKFIEASVIKDIPIWAFHGDKDNVCPIGPQLKLFAEMQELGGNMKLTTWAGDGHGIAEKMITGGDNGTTQSSSDRCYPEPNLMKWLFTQKRSPDWVKLYQPDIYKDMTYRLVKPINYNPKKSYPVIVSLHGGAGRGTNNFKQLRPWTEVLVEEQRRKDYPAYILAPQSQGRWNTDHLQLVKEIISDLPAVDMNKIYVLGHSMGAAGTYTFIQADPGYFAAAAPSAGRGGEVDASVIKDLPMWAFHGDKDETVPIEGNQELFAEMQKIGGNMKFTIWVGDGHGVTTKFITGSDNGNHQASSERCDPEQDFLKWLFSQNRTAK